DTRQGVELLDQSMETLVVLPPYRLQPACVVDMDDPWHLLEDFLAETQRALHVGRGLIILEVCRTVLVQDGWCKGTELFAKLDAAIDLVLDVGATGVSQDRPVAQGAGSELRSPLYPADDLSFGQGMGRYLVDRPGVLADPLSLVEMDEVLEGFS